MGTMAGAPVHIGHPRPLGRRMEAFRSGMLTPRALGYATTRVLRIDT